MPKKKTAEATAKQTARRKAGTGGKKARKASSPAPAATPASATLRVKQVRSGIGHAETYRLTLRALGLRHHQHEVSVLDSPSIRGMLRKVWHLVAVRPEGV